MTRRLQIVKKKNPLFRIQNVDGEMSVVLGRHSDSDFLIRGVG